MKGTTCHVKPGWSSTRHSRWDRSTRGSSAPSSSTWAAACTRGIYEPGHPTADADGLRDRRAGPGPGARRHRDPLSRAATSSPATTGRTASARPSSVRAGCDPAWRSIETNQFGLGEFMALPRQGRAAEPMLAVNLGTRGVAEALELHEYANHPGGTALVRPARRPRRQGPVRHPAVVPGQRDGRPLADRAQDGRRVRPPGRRDGPGDAPDRPGHRTGRLRQLQPRACRRSALGKPLCSSDAYDLVDYVSMHAYYEELDGDRDSFLASAVDMESFIEQRGRHLRPRGRPAEVREEDQHLLRRVERLVPVQDP